VVDRSWLTPVHKLDGAGALATRLTAYEKALIEEALLASADRYWSTGAAARLRLARTTLESRIRALRINKSRFRPHGIDLADGYLYEIRQWRNLVTKSQ